jgi:hypothetical protein
MGADARTAIHRPMALYEGPSRGNGVELSIEWVRAWACPKSLDREALSGAI